MTHRRVLDTVTDPEAADVLWRAVQRLTPAERLVMGCAMYDAARDLALAGLRAQGVKDASELKIALFFRFYGSDVDQAELPRLLSRLRASVR